MEKYPLTLNKIYMMMNLEKSVICPEELFENINDKPDDIRAGKVLNLEQNSDINQILQSEKGNETKLTDSLNVNSLKIVQSYPQKRKLKEPLNFQSNGNFKRFTGLIFKLIGNFYKPTKDQLVEIIGKHDGVVCEKFTKKINIVVVGEEITKDTSLLQAQERKMKIIDVTELLSMISS